MVNKFPQLTHQVTRVHSLLVEFNNFFLLPDEDEIF